MKRIESGASLLEYSITLAFICFVAVVSVHKLGMKISSSFDDASANIAVCATSGQGGCSGGPAPEE